MPGAIAIVIVLLLIPVAVLMGGGFAAALLGNSLQRDGKIRSEGSELSDLGD